MAVLTPAALTRRRFLSPAAASAGITLLHGIAKPYQPRGRPAAHHARRPVGRRVGRLRRRLGARRPAGPHAGRDRDHRQLHGCAQRVAVDALPESDFTAKALIENLPPGQDIFYRIRFQDLSSPTIVGEPVVGRFRTAPSARRSVSFVWSGDTAGQGWGIDEARGGMRTYATMLSDAARLLHPLRRQHLRRLSDPDRAQARRTETSGATSSPRRSRKVAETLAEYRGNYKYNLLDENLRAFNAEVPMFAQWDDHEVVDDWWPGQPLRRDGYAEKQHRCCSRRAAAVRSTSSCRRARPGPSPAASTAGSATVRCSTCSCSTCAATAARTARARRATGRERISSGPRSSPG